MAAIEKAINQHAEAAAAVSPPFTPPQPSRTSHFSSSTPPVSEATPRRRRHFYIQDPASPTTYVTIRAETVNLHGPLSGQQPAPVSLNFPHIAMGKALRDALVLLSLEETVWQVISDMVVFDIGESRRQWPNYLTILGINDHEKNLKIIDLMDIDGTAWTQHVDRSNRRVALGLPPLNDDAFDLGEDTFDFGPATADDLASISMDDLGSTSMDSDTEYSVVSDTAQQHR